MRYLVVMRSERRARDENLEFDNKVNGGCAEDTVMGIWQRHRGWGLHPS
jgi:hypothetical protein